MGACAATVARVAFAALLTGEFLGATEVAIVDRGDEFLVRVGT